MIKIQNANDLKRLRRIALSSQGLLKSKSFGLGLSGALKAINHLGYIQLDTISVVERAHHHVFHARVPNYKSSMSNQLLLNGEVFEYWSHAAALLPIDDYRFSLPYKHAIKSGQTHWYKDLDKKLMSELLARVRSEGPLRSRDIETKKQTNAGWWDWKPAKKALEQLYMEGELMVCDRTGFQKTYDLTERVLPSNVNSTMPSIEEFAAHMIEQQLRCHGFVTLKSITYLRRNTDLRNAVKKEINKRLNEGDLEQLQIDNSVGDVFFIETGALDQTLPRLNNRMQILSPFDNCVIQRERLKSIFKYDYKIECYVPEAKRQYGYFSLPLLFRDEFIGRMDCKAHRKNRHFEIKSFYLEQHSYDNDLVINAFVKAVETFCKFQDCDTLSLTKAYPTQLTSQLTKALTHLS